MLGVLGAFISIAINGVFRRIDWDGVRKFAASGPEARAVATGGCFPLLLSIAPKILMLMTLAFGQVVTTLALLTTLCGHVLVDLATWISRLDRVKFSWLGLGGSFLVRLLTWIVFMLGLRLCNLEFGISGMALSAMPVPAHVCSFVWFFSFGLPCFPPVVWG